MAARSSPRHAEAALRGEAHRLDPTHPFREQPSQLAQVDLPLADAAREQPVGIIQKWAAYDDTIYLVDALPAVVFQREDDCDFKREHTEREPWQVGSVTGQSPGLPSLGEQGTLTAQTDGLDQGRGLDVLPGK